MFNRTVFFAGDTFTQVNTVSGGIVKNHKDSFFDSFHLGSSLADRYLCDRPYRYEDDSHYNKKIYVEVLQMIMASDKYVIAEIIDLPDSK